MYESGQSLKTRGLSRRMAAIFCFTLILSVIPGCSVRPAPLPVERVDDLVRKAMDRTLIPGLSLAILEDGRIQSIRTYGIKNQATRDPVSETTVFEACSLSKPVLAYAALTLAAEGRLDLDKPMVVQASEEVLEREFFRRKIEDGRIRRLTPRMVLSHRSGFPNWRRQGKLDLIAEPGERFGYSGEGYVFLQKVMEQITGRPFNDFIKERVFLPLGMTSSSYVWIPEYDDRAAAPHSLFGEAGRKAKPSNANGAASLHTTSRDYALFLAAVLQGPGLREDLRRQMLTEQTAVSPGVGWGLGLGLEKSGGRKYLWHWGDNGDFKCFFMVDQKARTGFVYFSNGNSGLSPARQLARRLLGGVHPAFATNLMEEYESTDSPVFDLVKAAAANDLESGLRLVEQSRTKDSGRETIKEAGLNGFGYALLNRKRIDDAVKVFELNVRLYPRSWNTYDSLAEALEKRGDTAAAARNYELSLKLNPENTNAAERLKVLRTIK